MEFQRSQLEVYVLLVLMEYSLTDFRRSGMAIYRLFGCMTSTRLHGDTKWRFSLGRVNGSALKDWEGESTVYKQARLELCSSNSIKDKRVEERRMSFLVSRSMILLAHQKADSDS